MEGHVEPRRYSANICEVSGRMDGGMDGEMNKTCI